VKVLYRPDGQDEPTVYHFSVEDTMESQLELMEQQYGRLTGGPGSVDMLMLAITQGQASARRVLLWFLQNEVHPGKVKIEGVDFKRKQLQVEADRADLVWLRAKFASSNSLSPKDLEQLLAAIDAQIAAFDEASNTVDGELVDAGKALSPVSDAPTG
jgi:hypothetical protein